MEDLKIEKGKTYTYEELKEIYQNARIRTLENPTRDFHEDDVKFQTSMLLSGMIILNTLEDILFEKDKKE